ncbi:hypothetical protein ABPG72_000837 [Tetrahymena utriculariae]
MRSIMRAISNYPEWTDKKWMIPLGMNYFKLYAIYKNIYLDQTIKQPFNRKERDLKIYYFDGFLKNQSQFNHIKSLTKNYQCNLFYVDALQFLMHDIFQKQLKDQKDSLIQSIQSKNSIFICNFDSIQILKNHFFPGRNLEEVDLVAISPYYQNYENINSIMQKQFLLNIQKSFVKIYSCLDNSEENDYTMQKYMNTKEFQDFINKYQNENSQQQNNNNLPFMFKTLNILLQTQDKILFQSQDSKIFHFNLEKTYQNFDSCGFKTQYLIKNYSPVMSLLYKDPSAIILDQLLKERFSNK